MKLANLIKELQEIYNKNGDMTVFVDESGIKQEITFIEYGHYNEFSDEVESVEECGQRPDTMIIQ